MLRDSMTYRSDCFVFNRFDTGDNDKFVFRKEKKYHNDCYLHVGSNAL